MACRQPPAFAGYSYTDLVEPPPDPAEHRSESVIAKTWSEVDRKTCREGSCAPRDVELSLDLSLAVHPPLHDPLAKDKRQHISLSPSLHVAFTFGGRDPETASDSAQQRERMAMLRDLNLTFFRFKMTFPSLPSVRVKLVAGWGKASVSSLSRHLPTSCCLHAHTRSVLSPGVAVMFYEQHPQAASRSKAL